MADWLILTPDFLGGEDRKQWEDEGGEFRQKIDHMPDVESVDGKNVRDNYQAVRHLYS